MKIRNIILVINLIIVFSFHSYSNEMWRMINNTERFRNVLISPDGRYAASLGISGVLKVNNIENNKTFIQNFNGVIDIILKFDDNDNIMCVSSSNKKRYIITYDFITNKIAKQTELEKSDTLNISEIKITYNNKYIIGKGNKVYIWNAEDGKYLKFFSSDSGFKNYIISVSEVSNSIGIMEQTGKLHLINIDSNTMLNSFDVKFLNYVDLKAVRMNLIKDSIFVLYDNYSTMEVYKGKSGIREKRIFIPTKTIDIVKFTNNETDILIMDWTSNKLDIYNLANVIDLESAVSKDSVDFQEDMVRNLDVLNSNDKTLILLGGKNLRVYDLSKRKMISSFYKFTDDLNTGFSNDDINLIITKYKASPYYYNFSTNEGKLALFDSIGSGMSVINQVITKKNLLIGFNEDSVILFDYKLKNNVDEININGKNYSPFKFATDLNFYTLWIKDSGFINLVFDYPENKQIYRNDYSLGYQFSKSSKYFFGSEYEGSIKNISNIVRSLDNFNIIFKKSQEIWDGDCSLSSDDKNVFIPKYDNSSICIFDMKSGDSTGVINTSQLGWTGKFDVTSDSRYVISGNSKGGVDFFDIELQKITKTVGSFPLQVNNFAISPSKKYLAVSYADASIVMYDINGILDIQEFYNINEISNFSISPNPATDYISISIINRRVNPAVDKVEIYDILGILYTSPNPLLIEGEQVRLDVSGFVPGVYFVKIGDRVQRFVKM